MAEVTSEQQDREARERVKKSVDDIVSITNKVYETTQQLAKSASNLAKAGQESIKMAKMLQEKNADTMRVIEFITNIAGQTNLLGLNAAIEAARADVYSASGAVLFDFNGLDVCIPLSSCMTIGVGYVVTGYLTLAADFALS